MINVTKRDGAKEALDLEKIHQILFFSCEGLAGVSVSEIEMKAQLQFYEGIETNDIHEIIIKAASELISEDTPNYQYVAGRLINYSLRKKVYGNFEPIKFLSHVQKLVQKEIYDPEFLVKFSVHEIEELGKYIKHKRDDKFTFVAMKQWEGKYLCKNRATKEIYETPQMAYMMIAATVFMEYSKDVRMSYVKRFYDAISNFDISLPTPIMSGLRTNTRQFSSCVVLNVGDSLDSIGASNQAILKYISKKAGLGINYGRVRAEGSEIRGGDAVHTGLIPFLSAVAKTVKSCSQGGVRGGAATVHFPLWHLEFENLVVLKNNKGVETTRVRQLDYCFQINKTLYERLVERKNITFFSPSDVPGLYEAFCADQNKFKQLYEKYEKDSSIRKISKPAIEVFSTLMTERAETGRIYIQNIDLVNEHSPFDASVAPIEQSNLCVVPETKILTDVGYITISEYENEFVNVWNGKQFSSVQIKKTGTNQKIVKVKTDSGYELECTEYHKFYVQTDYRGNVQEKRAHELKPGDKLIKLETPIISGDIDLPYAYENGFYSGDGCLVRGKQRIYLYGEKRNLKNNFNFNKKWLEQDEYDRSYVEVSILKDKFFVPDWNYTIESRLKFLEGIFDADGCVYRNGSNDQLVLVSIEFEFLKEIQLMLQTLGIQSKITNHMKEGTYSLPDGNGSYKDYDCNESKRLIISSYELYKLNQLGFNPSRLQLNKNLPNRNASRFVKILEVLDENRTDDTYCFNEELEHKAVFNGILTGQCQEIALPSVPFEDVNAGNEGLISLCTLSAINWGNFETPDQMQEACELSIRALDALLDYQDYPMQHAERATKAYRPLGVGIINLAYFLAKRGLKYDSDALETINEWTEAWSYYLIEASVKLAKEQGRCELYDNLKYAKGILPIDTYKKSIDSLVSTELKMDWDTLRADIATYGIRNATVMAIMPAETSAQISNSSNGIEMPRNLVSIKASKDGILKQVVPEIGKLKNKYSLLWDQTSNEGYLQICGVLQKYIDQSISANTSYNPVKYPDNKLSMKVLLADLLLSYKLGIKNLYYMNSNDGSGEIDVEAMEKQHEKSSSTEGFILPDLLDDDDCDSCKI